ncbi:hypothetical protein CFC21_056319, partial [Triticum aestivum]
MGFIHKGGVWWFLLLAGVLLAAAAAAGAEQDDGAVATAVPEVEEADEARLRVDDPEENDSCDLKCQHHQVPARKKQCVDECHSREHHHPSRASCENKCSHWQDPTRKDQCVQQCMRRGLSLAVGGGNDVDEHRHAQEEEVAGGVPTVLPKEVPGLERSDQAPTVRATVRSRQQHRRRRAPPRLGSGGRRHHRGGV